MSGRLVGMTLVCFNLHCSSALYSNQFIRIRNVLRADKRYQRNTGLRIAHDMSVVVCMCVCDLARGDIVAT